MKTYQRITKNIIIIEVLALLIYVCLPNRASALGPISIDPTIVSLHNISAPFEQVVKIDNKESIPVSFSIDIEPLAQINNHIVPSNGDVNMKKLLQAHVSVESGGTKVSEIILPAHTSKEIHLIVDQLDRSRDYYFCLLLISKDINQTFPDFSLSATIHQRAQFASLFLLSAKNPDDTLASKAEISSFQSSSELAEKLDLLNSSQTFNHSYVYAQVLDLFNRQLYSSTIESFYTLPEQQRHLALTYQIPQLFGIYMLNMHIYNADTGLTQIHKNYFISFPLQPITLILIFLTIVVVIWIRIRSKLKELKKQ